MRIALTGSNGFTGKYVARELRAQGIECVPLSVNLCDSEAVAAAVAETPFDRLIHLAAIAFVASDDWRSFYDVNLLGTLNLLDAVARYRPGSRCVLASSAQVYGPAASGCISEEDPTRPGNAYGASKLAMEFGTSPWQSKLDIVVTRPFNYTGVGQEARYLIPKIVGHFRDRAPKIELGNLSVGREFGDVRSVAEAYCALALIDGGEPVLNLCTGDAWRINDIITKLEEMTGHSIEVEVNPQFVRADDVPLLVGDNGRLRKTLPQWQPRQLNDTLDWMLASS